MNHIIDAEGKSIGRVASVAASLLAGKTEASYSRNKVAEVKVEIVNASKTKISEKKKLEKKYEQYSGYPGGFRETSLSDMIAHKGYGEIYRLAVYGMLPRNKLRPIMMKNLTIKD